MNIGIESIEFCIPHYYLDLASLAIQRQIDPQKFYIGLGQEKMAIAAPNEDAITLGANAAFEALKSVDRSAINTIIYATESGVDQSKAGAIYIHNLLDLPDHCIAFDIKQACYGATAALQAALGMINLNPHQKILIVAADIAQYELGSPGEPTQGAGAVAMVISANPKIIKFDNEFGSHTEDIMDFWRPNHKQNPIVDGKFSIKMYLKALEICWRNYCQQTHQTSRDLLHCCYHLPFNRMAEKANRMLAMSKCDDGKHASFCKNQYFPGLYYGSQIGNCYTASLYISLISQLSISKMKVPNGRIGLFSYGSGCVASFFSGTIMDNAWDYISVERNNTKLEIRTELNYQQYLNFRKKRPSKPRNYRTNDAYYCGLFQFSGLQNDKRIYQKTTISNQSFENDTNKVDQYSTQYSYT